MTPLGCPFVLPVFGETVHCIQVGLASPRTFNSRKAGRNISLREFREENAREGRLRVPSTDNLIDLGWAENEALEYFVNYRMGQR